MYQRLLILLFMLSGMVYLAYSQDEIKPWDRFGLSQTEWKMVKDNNIPMPKLEQILKAGIGVGEYLQKPWENLKMSEDTWIKKRRSGLTSYDIELEAAPPEKDNWKGSLKTDSKQDIQHFSGNGELFSSLFLPGYYQLKTDQKLKGAIMISAASGSLIWCAAGSIAHKRFDGVPIFFVLVPDMVWSLIDYKISQRKNKSKS